jgi:hypothetical protein
MIPTLALFCGPPKHQLTSTQLVHLMVGFTTVRLTPLEFDAKAIRIVTWVVK